MVAAGPKGRPDLQEVGDYVQTRRGHLGLSQVQLADRAGVDKGTISRLETGAGWPWSTKRAAIERALGLQSGALTQARKQAAAGISLFVPQDGAA
jgi:transcriptional regulator with XRE-family HTH domain